MQVVTCARGDAASHAKGISLIRDTPSDTRDGPFDFSGGSSPYSPHIAPTWLQGTHLQSCWMADHVWCIVVWCLVNVYAALCFKVNTSGSTRGVTMAISLRGLSVSAIGGETAGATT